MEAEDDGKLEMDADVETSQLGRLMRMHCQWLVQDLILIAIHTHFVPLGLLMIHH